MSQSQAKNIKINKIPCFFLQIVKFNNYFEFVGKLNFNPKKIKKSKKAFKKCKKGAQNMIFWTFTAKFGKNALFRVKINV